MFFNVVFIISFLNYLNLKLSIKKNIYICWAINLYNYDDTFKAVKKVELVREGADGDTTNVQTWPISVLSVGPGLRAPRLSSTIGQVF